MRRPPARPPLPEQIRTRIATEVLRRTVPALLFTLALALIAIRLGPRGHESRLVPIGTLVAALVVVWWMVRSGRTAGAAHALVAALCLAILAGMVINGGVLAPAFTATIPVLAIVGWLYGVRPAATFAAATVTIGGMLVWADHLGRLRHVPPPTPVMTWLLVGSFLAITFGVTALPLRLLRDALADSEARRGEAEAAARRIADREAALRQAERALRAEKTLTDAIFAGMPGLLYVFDDQGHTVRWNGMAGQILGLARDELSHACLGDYLLPADRPRARAASEAVMRDGRPVTLEATVLTSRGPATYVLSGVRVMIDGRPHMLGIGIDITDRKRAEEAHRREKAVTDAVFDNVPAVLSLYDDAGRLVRWNRKSNEITGFSDEELGRRRVGDAQPPEERGKIADAARRIHDHGQTVTEASLMTKSGGRIPFFYTGVRIVIDGRPHVLSIGVDISERKRAEEHLRDALAQAEAANRAKDHFLAAASHELRTPLAPVLLLTSALEADPQLPPVVRQDLGVIREHVEVEKRLIGDLLDFTAIHAGKLHVRPVPTDVHDVIRAALRTCQESIDRKGLRVDVRLDARRHQTLGDADRLRQVFWNLLQNAVKFTPDGGTITVHTNDDDGPTLRVEVSDTGRGMDTETLRRLFRPFEQGPRDERMQHYGGLGLGLAISKTLVEAHGGSISATSVGPGRGSTFVVRLPTAAPQHLAPPPPPPPGSVTATPPPRLKLLLVEDHPLTLKTLARLLNADGHYVTTAMSVAEAIRLAAAERFDLVLSDIGLPDGSGLDLMPTLRDRHGLPGIALSGFGADADLEASAKAGFLAHVTKPVTLDAIRDVLNRFASTPAPSS